MASSNLTVKVQRDKFSRTYEVTEMRPLTGDTAVLIGTPVYKGSKKGRPRVIGHVVLDTAAAA